MRNRRKYSKRIMAASKLLGFVVVLGAAAVIVYSMFVILKVAEDAIKMGITPDMSALNTLIGGVFTVMTAYIGFYINMAKAEHIEDKKNEIKKEIRRIEKDCITPEESVRLSELKEELYAFGQKLDEISNGQGDIYNG